MALLTRHDAVLTQQGEGGHAVVVELVSLVPRIFYVAGLALLTFLTFVLVVFFVTREAVHRQLVFDQIALVAGSTLQRRRLVLAEKREFGLLVVIEDGFLPIVLVVASLALDAEFTLMRLVVVFLVARDTGHL